MNLLGVVLDELPGAISKVADYGVKHLVASHANSHLVSLPGVGRRPSDFMSAGAAIGVVFALLVLVIGIVSLIRYMRIDYRLHNSKGVQLENKERGNERWGLLRFVNVSGNETR